MDNMVMIQAGDLIDNTIGVHFGFATLTAAAFGQVFSDVSGVAFGGTVEAAATRLGLPIPDLTQSQRSMRITKLVGTTGAMVGVIIGCLLGMTSLLFMDLDAADRAKRQAELDTIFNTVIEHGHWVVQAERGTLFMVDEEKGELWSKVALGTHLTYTMPIDNKSIAGTCVKLKDTVNVTDAYNDPRFDSSFDKMSNFKTRDLLCVPVFEHDIDEHDLVDTESIRSRKVIAVVQMINKMDSDKGFTEGDVDLVEMLAKHVSIFIGQVNKKSSS